MRAPPVSWIAAPMHMVLRNHLRNMNRLKGPVEPEAPKTRECPECLSMVPALAHRCAQCTSVLPPPTVAIV